MARILWILVAVLVLLWLAGTVIGFLGDIIHVVLVVAVALAIFAFIKRKV
ncbi:MAG: lmo0937 family membrane protein [Thermoanaerobaculia bacterium]